MIKTTELFKIFFKIGAFTIGGGYAMLSIVEHEIVEKHKFIEKQEFWDLIGLVQTLPGVFAINTALFVGNKLRGWRGAFMAALGAALPSFIAILLIAIFFKEIKDNAIVESVFCGIRPCVIALILVPALKLLISQKLPLTKIWLPFVAAILIWQFKVSPILIILVVSAFALIMGIYNYRKIQNS